jgi:hypothetical protein
MGAPHISAWLSYLATERRVSASTQNQALSAILFLYREVMGADLDRIEGVERAKKPSRLPWSSSGRRCLEYSRTSMALAGSWLTSCTGQDYD